MENKKPNKTTLTAIVVSAVLVLVLIVSIILNVNLGLNQTKKELRIELGSVETLNLDRKEFFKVDEDTIEDLTFDTSGVDVNAVGTYNVTVKYNGRTYSIKVIVEDTTVPKVEMAERIVYTNNIATIEADKLIKNVTDKSDCTAKLIRFEKTGTLSVMDELTVNNLLEKINTPGNAKELNALGSEAVPTEQGLYRSVVEIADVHGNAAYEEVYVVLDTTGAQINEVVDQVVTVKKDKLTAQPELDKSLYKGLDTVDGTLTADDFVFELVLRDEAKHEWLVKVSHTDRAGNTASSEFLITVQEEKTQSSNKPSSDKDSTSDKNTGNKNESSSDKNGSGNSGSSNNNNSSSSKPSKDPMDANNDGFVSEDEEMSYITPEKQACIDAGYGVVCEFDNHPGDGSTWYGILMKDSKHEINGKRGWEILSDYLTERNLEGNIYGCWIDTEKGWYWYIAEYVHEIEEDIEF